MSYYGGLRVEPLRMAAGNPSMPNRPASLSHPASAGRERPAKAGNLAQAAAWRRFRHGAAGPPVTG
jgi:hypothetical protein